MSSSGGKTGGKGGTHAHVGDWASIGIFIPSLSYYIFEVLALLVLFKTQIFQLYFVSFITLYIINPDSWHMCVWFPLLLVPITDPEIGGQVWSISLRASGLRHTSEQCVRTGSKPRGAPGL